MKTGSDEDIRSVKLPKDQHSAYLEDGVAYAPGIVTTLDELFNQLVRADAESQPLFLMKAEFLQQHVEGFVHENDRLIHTENNQGDRLGLLKRRLTELGAQCREFPEIRWVLIHALAGEYAGIRSAVTYLCDVGQEDLPRGEALPLMTPKGPVDVSRSAYSIQCDLGRWSRTEEVAGIYQLTVDRTCEVQGSLDQGNEDELKGRLLLKFSEEEVVTVSFDRQRSSDGVAVIELRDCEGNLLPTANNGLAASAALAFRSFLHQDSQLVHNFWRVESEASSLAVRMYPTEEGEHVALAGPVIKRQE